MEKSWIHSVIMISPTYHRNVIILANKEKIVASTWAGVIFETSTNGTNKVKIIENLWWDLEPNNRNTKPLIPMSWFYRITRQKSVMLLVIYIKIMALNNALGFDYWTNVLYIRIASTDHIPSIVERSCILTWLSPTSSCKK